MPIFIRKIVLERTDQPKNNEKAEFKSNFNTNYNIKIDL